MKDEQAIKKALTQTAVLKSGTHAING